MARKHAAKNIATQRIEYLYELAQKWLGQERVEDSKRAITHAKKLATSHVISIPHINKNACKNCHVLLTPKTSHTRIHNNLRIITCKECDTIRRIGF